MKRYIVAGGIVVSAAGREQTNLLIENGKVTEWVSDPEQRALPILDARDKLILPGLIDAHTHFHMASGDLFTVDDFVHGGKLAASAGVTSIIDFIEPAPEEDLERAILARFEDVRGCPLDYQFHLVIPHRFARSTNWYKLMERYQLAAVKGFTTYREEDLCLDAQDLRALLAWSKARDGLLTIHAEDDRLLETAAQVLMKQAQTDIRHFAQSRPAVAEQQAVENLVAMAGRSASLYFVHISTRAALEALAQAKQAGSDGKTWVETCPQYLVLDQSLYESEFADRATVCPPLRTAEDQTALWQGIRKGTIDVVASDHCAFTGEMKTTHSWLTPRAGLPTVDAILPVLVNGGIARGLIDWEDIVRVTAENPARLFHLQGKGSLMPGNDADFVVISTQQYPEKKGPYFQSRAGYSLFERDYLERSWLEYVVRRGEILWHDGWLSGSMGEGCLIPLT